MINNMAKGYRLFILLTSLTLVAGLCPPEAIRSLGQCAFRIDCIGTIKGVRLHSECMEATNFPVTVDMTLHDPIDGDEDDPRLLGLITTLKVIEEAPITNLTYLQHAYRLQILDLSYNQIKTIHGSPFYTLTNLESVDLSNNKLSVLKDLFRFEIRRSKLTTLYLAHNNIEDLPKDVFDELESLVDLDLSFNRISNLTEEPFSNLSSLEILRLNNNSIKNLNGAVNNLQNLKHLYLRGNQIQHIDEESLKIIIHLETFDVSRNQLEKINSIMFSRHWNHIGGHSVCKIILSENRITSLPNASMELTPAFYDTRSRHRNSRDLRRYNVDVLTELDLSNNEISEIAYNAFHSLLRMTSLDLSRNQIVEFKVNDEDLRFVRYLNLSRNNIIQLYFAGFSSMKNLESLDLSHNQLHEVPETTFSNNFHIRILNITSNHINVIENLHISRFHDGGVLDLSYNNLTQFRIPYGEGASLTILRLHTNNISDPKLIDLTHQNDLKNLDLSRNKICELNDTSLRIPVSLNHLDVSHNAITRVGPSSFYRASHLRNLCLSHNQLKTIEYGAFYGLTMLLDLDLSYNKFATFNSEWLLDLKSLTSLSLRNNWMYNLDYKSWYSHKYHLNVYIEGNNLSCEWLSEVLRLYNSGFLNMRPTVKMPIIVSHSIEGIPCVAKSTSGLGRLNDGSMSNDDRLLVTNQKILEAVREQNSFMRRYVRLIEKTTSAKL